MKKIINIIIAAVTALALSATAFASEAVQNETSVSYLEDGSHFILSLEDAC